MPDLEAAALDAGAASDAINDGGNGDALAVQPDLGDEAQQQGADQQVDGAVQPDGDKDQSQQQQPADQLPEQLTPELKALFRDPKVGKLVQSTWDALQSYRGVFPTLAAAKAVAQAFPSAEDAMAAAQKASLLDEADLQFTSDDPQERLALAEEWYQDNPEAFGRMVQTSVEYLRNTNPQGYSQLVSDATKQALASDKFDAHVELFRQAIQSGDAEALKQLSTDLVNWADGKGFSGREPVRSPMQMQMEREQKALQTERDQVFSQQRQHFQQAIATATADPIWDNTLASLEPLFKDTPFSPEDQQEIAQEVFQRVDQQLRSDRMFQAQLSRLVGERGRPKTDDRTKTQITNLIVSRAKAIIPTTARQIVGRYSRFAVAATKANAGAKQRPDVTGGAPRNAGGARRIPSQDEANKKSTRELLGY